MFSYDQLSYIASRNTIHTHTHTHTHLRYDDNCLLVALDSGEVEMWQVMPPGSMLDCKASFSNGHQDMVLCLCVAGNNSVLSGGADGR